MIFEDEGIGSPSWGKAPDLFLYNNIICEDTDLKEFTDLEKRFSDIYMLEDYNEVDNNEDKFNILLEFISCNPELFNFDIDELEYLDDMQKYDFVEEYEDLILKQLEKNAEFQEYCNHNNYLEHENIILKNIQDDLEDDFGNQDDWY